MPIDALTVDVVVVNDNLVVDEKLEIIIFGKKKGAAAVMSRTLFLLFSNMAVNVVRGKTNFNVKPRVTQNRTKDAMGGC
ncbi:hypothetical protein L2E82_51115 [Cichorium intybus]|nr:hypothetical protein L2E82_51115 [Cichorium intybus]